MYVCDTILATIGVHHNFVQPCMNVTRSGAGSFPFVETLAIALRWLALAYITHKPSACIFSLMYRLPRVLNTFFPLFDGRFLR